MEMNKFDFVVVWIGKDEKERNGINFCLDRNK